MDIHSKLPSVDRLNQLYSVDGAGVVRHKKKCGAKCGSIAGSVMPSGYIRLKCDGRLYLAHRLIYKLFYGVDPMEMEVDHIDGKKGNNSPSNLRLATRSENRQNTGTYKSNTLNIKGVWFCNMQKKFFCSVQKSKKRYKFGPFDSAEKAGEKYKLEAKKLFGEFYPEGKI